MTKYELTVVLGSNKDEEELKSSLSEIKQFITDQKGEVKSEHLWGSRDLAYPINGQNLGHYATFEFESGGGVIVKLERFLRLHPEIIRFLTTVAYLNPSPLVETKEETEDATPRSAEESLRRFSSKTVTKRPVKKKVVIKETDEKERQQKVAEALGKILGDEPKEKPTKEKSKK